MRGHPSLTLFSLMSRFPGLTPSDIDAMHVDDVEDLLLILRAEVAVSKEKR